MIVDLGRTEAIIQKNEMIPRENIKAGDRVKAYCYDFRRESRGQQIFLSRAHPKFMEKLFVQEVPEIYDGLIEIKSSSRDPGSRAKICVKAVDTSLDPVGACVGMRGSRVQAVVNELQGEKIDIVNWSEDPAVVVSNALSPAEVQRVNVDIENKKLIGLDVGAQGGFNSDKFFPERYNKYFESILVDPLKNSLEGKESTHTINKGLWSSKGVRKLYILNKRPQSSSMYEPDKKSLSIYGFEEKDFHLFDVSKTCLLYTSPSPRD